MPNRILEEVGEQQERKPQGSAEKFLSLRLRVCVIYRVILLKAEKEVPESSNEIIHKYRIRLGRICTPISWSGKPPYIQGIM